MGPLEKACNDAMEQPVLRSSTVMQALTATEGEPQTYDPDKLLGDIVVPLVQGLRDAVRVIAKYLDERDAAGPVIDPEG